MYLFGDPLSRQTFRGSFILTSWKPENNPETQVVAKSIDGAPAHELKLRQALAALYRTSELRSCFVAADILALDR